MSRRFIFSAIIAMFLIGNVAGQMTETRTSTQTGATQTETVTTSGTTTQNGTTVYTYTHTHTHVSNIPVISGFKLGVNASDFAVQYTDDIQNSMKTGVSAGFFLKFDISKYAAFQYEIILHYKTSEMEDRLIGTKSDYEYAGIEIPLYVMGQIELGKGKGFIGAGPYVGLGLSSKYQPGNINLYKKDKATDSSIMNRWDFGAATIIGYEFNKVFTVSAGYHGGFINMLSDNGNASMKNQTVNLSVGIRF